MPDSQFKDGGFVNKVFYSFVRCEVSIASFRTVAFTSIEFNDGVELEPVFGAGQQPLGVGEGNYNEMGLKIDFLLEDFERVLLPLLVKNSATDAIYNHEPFDIDLSYGNGTANLVKRKLRGIRINKMTEKAAQGDKTIVASCEGLILSGIIRSGLKPVLNVLKNG